MKRLYLLSLLAISSVAAPSFSSPLIGHMDPGYDLPYLWSSYAGYANPDWMEGIDDSKTLAEISIPGTHNSLSTGGNLYSITQTLGAIEQMFMGIRYFDVRFKYEDGVLQAYHGDFKQDTTFEDFMSEVSMFLRAYPSETVLIRIQNEAGASTNQVEFFERFKAISSQHRSQQSIPSSSTPRLGDVRGKFIFIRDFNVTEVIGLERANFMIQDNYTVSTNWSLYRKWEDIKTHYNKIAPNQGRNISLNYLSGSNIAFPYFVASGKSSSGSRDPQLWTGASTWNRQLYPDFPRRHCLGSLCSIYFAGTNQLTNSWIENGEFSGNLGIVVMDFPGGALVDNIIQTNGNDETTPKGFTIFDQKAFKGNSLQITKDMPTLGLWDNKMSSFTIPKGWEVRFYEHENYEGGYYTRLHSGDALGINKQGRTVNFENKVSSIKILERPQELLIYDQADYSGEVLAITKDTPALGAEWDNKMSSFVIPKGWEIRFYQHENYQGGYYTRNHSSNATGFDKQISSIRILRQ